MEDHSNFTDYSLHPHQAVGELAANGEKIEHIHDDERRGDGVEQRVRSENNRPVAITSASSTPCSVQLNPDTVTEGSTNNHQVLDNSRGHEDSLQRFSIAPRSFRFFFNTLPPQAPFVAVPHRFAPTSSSPPPWVLAQIADQPRQQCDRNGNAKVKVDYLATVEGKWWYRSPEKFASWSPEVRKRFSHVALIMETELGEKREGWDRCRDCRSKDFECWAYSEEGVKQLEYTTQRCARCLAHGKNCSLIVPKKRG